MTDAGAPAPLLLPDPTALADLATFVGRARRVDPDGAARLLGGGSVLAVYVSPLHARGLGDPLPTVLGLRANALAEPSHVDAVVPLAALADRLARPPSPGTGPVRLPVPPVPAPRTPWAAVSPPRGGWRTLGVVDVALLAGAAREGVAEIAAGTPAGAGAAAVDRLRAAVWGRSVPGLEQTPAGAAFAADALGFLAADEPVVLHACGLWRRLTSSRGHVLARSVRG